ncbi:CcdC protein domain-containing protein [Streptomyces tsukubensis]|uniref:DUF1453 domain-containing protein n=1 Tax=Streptomyces tsukubensis TaxID=83656 RepID=A0A1V4A481_9ACTN|nr:CcdC protein domain-containing protein [Streptomyces tsukubensis]OON75134.1 hypothetical protein B1H18_23540 [Streptomyces tsukubensis]QFR96119.1 DUF1453 family protein [Streptomyces tsukubensis]
MSGPVEILAIGVAVVLVVARLVRPQAVGGGRWWLLPVVLAAVSLRQSGLVDGRHPAQSVTLLVLEAVVGVVIGLGWGWTSRLWTEPDGSVWAKGTKAAILIWVGGILVRGVLYGVGAALDLKQTSSAIMLSLAATLLARGGVLTYRAGLLSPAYGERAGVERERAWKDRV